MNRAVLVLPTILTSTFREIERTLFVKWSEIKKILQIMWFHRTCVSDTTVSFLAFFLVSRVSRLEMTWSV